MSNGTITMTGAEYDALTSKIAQLEAELAKLRARQEPVAYITGYHGGRCIIEPVNRAAVLPSGMALYSTPQPNAGQDGCMIVPIQPTEEMRKRAQDYLAAEGMIVSDWLVHTAYTEMLAAAPTQATVQGDGWIPVSERLPESERTVLAFYLNSHGKGRRVRAEYIAAKTKSADDGWDSDEPADYDEQADEYFWPAGWYEVMDNWDCLTHMAIHEGEVTHWMPLPAAPGRQEGGKI